MLLKGCSLIRLLILFMIIPKILFANQIENFLSKKDEDRAQKLFLQIKCLACQGQVIENSDTQIAFEMRKLIREQINSGLKNEEIKEKLVKEYGSQILTDPPFNIKTFYLWLLPILTFFFGFVIILFQKSFKGRHNLPKKLN